jgi:hypothetical protein
MEGVREEGITKSFYEIRKMKKDKFSRKNTLIYIKNMQKSKWSKIVYKNIELADYLQPLEKEKKLFAVRNRMVQIPNNFPKSENKAICFCGKVFNEKMNPSKKYENIYDGTKFQVHLLFLPGTLQHLRHHQQSPSKIHILGNSAQLVKRCMYCLTPKTLTRTITQ